MVQKELKQQQEIDGAISLARMVLRQDAIGTDRNHDRYWVFTNTTPGLYVEKGEILFKLRCLFFIFFHFLTTAF